MRVLHVHSGNLYGGVETLLLTLARYEHLCHEMSPHFALCFEGRLSEELRAADAPLYLLGQARIRRPLTVMRARNALDRLLRHELFDLVVCHSAWTQSLFGPVVRAAQRPLVLWLHDATSGRHWLNRWGSRTEPVLALCDSRFTATTLSNVHQQARPEVIYYPVAFSERRYSDAECASTRTEFETGQEDVIIIQVSRMEAWKGHSLLLEALGQLKSVPGWVCWQVGGAQRPQELRYAETLKEMAVRFGVADRVRFLGQRSDVARLLAAADIHCQPNIGPEPFGITFIEALYAGLPVVTTAIGGACEIVEDTCGVLVPPGNAPALAASLRRLIEDRTLRMKLGAAGPMRARQLCDPATQMGRLHELLASAVFQEVAV